MDSRSCWTTARICALLFADVVGRFFDGFFESRDEEEKEWRYGYGDEGEVPVEPEHEAEHADDGEEIDEDVERGGGGEALDGLDVGGEGAEDRAGLVGAVVAEGEALQMLIHTHAEIVGDPLANALGVVVVDVGGGRADDGDHYERKRQQEQRRGACRPAPTMGWSR